MNNIYTLNTNSDDFNEQLQQLKNELNSKGEEIISMTSDNKQTIVIVTKKVRKKRTKSTESKSSGKKILKG